MEEGHQHAGDTVDHQDAIEDVARDVADDAVDEGLVDASDHAAIADLDAPSVGYVQAEAAATRTAVNGILDVLRDAGLLPSA